MVERKVKPAKVYEKVVSSTNPHKNFLSRFFVTRVLKAHFCRFEACALILLDNLMKKAKFKVRAEVEEKIMKKKKRVLRERQRHEFIKTS